MEEIGGPKGDGKCSRVGVRGIGSLSLGGGGGERLRCEVRSGSSRCRIDPVTELRDASDAVRGRGGRLARGGSEGAREFERTELDAEKKPPSEPSSIVRDERDDSRREPPRELIERDDPKFDVGLGPAEVNSSLAPLRSPPPYLGCCRDGS